MTGNDLKAIQAWSRVMKHLCVGGAALFLLGAIYQLLTMDAVKLAAWLDVPSVRTDHGRAIGIFVLFVLPALVIAHGFARMRRSFQCFSRGDIFSEDAIAGLQQFAAASVLSVLVAGALAPVIGLWLTYGTPEGVGIAFRIGSGSLTILLMAGFTWVFARILRVAVAVRRQNKALTRENAAFV